MNISAGILPFRLPFEVLIGHPGGPFWAHRDEGAWSVIKGQVHDGETMIAAARREFSEETGWIPPEGTYIDLGSVTLRSRKQVQVWAVEASFEPADLDPGLFTMTWRGVSRDFPEIDRVVWAGPDDAARLLNPTQAAFVGRLEGLLGILPSSQTHDP